MEANADDPTVSIHRLSRSQSFLPNPDFRRHALALSTVSCIIADSYDGGGRCGDMIGLKMMMMMMITAFPSPNPNFRGHCHWPPNTGACPECPRPSDGMFP